MTVRHDLSIYAAYFARFLKARMAYRADFFADVFATALGTTASLLFVFILFVPIDVIAGWKRDEILFIYGLSLIPYGLYSTISWNLYEFGDRYIIEGNFDRVLLRPLNSFLQVAFESFRIQSLTDAVIGVIIVVTSSVSLGLAPGPLDWVWMAVAILSGTTILIAVFGSIASLSFHFEDRIGIAPPVFNLITAGRYPVEIFGPVIRFLLRFVVPFSFVAFYPSTHLLGHSEFRTLCLMTPLVAAISLVVLTVMWRLGVKRYSSTGS